jgi:hypothetical protein
LIFQKSTADISPWLQRFLTTVTHSSTNTIEQMGNRWDGISYHSAFYFPVDLWPIAVPKKPPSSA